MFILLSKFLGPLYTVPAYYSLTTSNAPLSVPLTPGEAYTSADFGYQEKGTVSGHLYIDTNGDGDQDEGEPDLVAVDVIITDSTGVNADRQHRCQWQLHGNRASWQHNRRCGRK